MTRKEPEMTTTLHQMIDGLELENDLEGLGNLLVDHEDDDDALFVLYAAIDRVAAKLDTPINLDEIWTIS